MKSGKGAEEQSPEEQGGASGGREGGVQAGRDVRAGRDIAGRDIFAYSYSSDLLEVLSLWQSQMAATIEAQPDLSPDEKQDLKDQVKKIGEEAAKGEKLDRKRLEKLINTLAVWSSDIFEVAVATLVNPLAGIGLALKKISDRAKLEAAKSK
jgi:hypothetical protein